MIEILFGGVLPIFAIAAIGFWFGRQGLFDVAMASAINRFVFYVAIPALGLRLLIRAPMDEFNLTLQAGFLATEIIVYASVFVVSRYLFKTDAKEAILLGLACALTNHILFVLPIATTLFGEAATAPIVAIITTDIILLFSGTLIVMELMSSRGNSIKQVFGKISKNPPILSIIIGLVISLGNLEIPQSLDVFLGFTGGAAAPCALFAMGIILSQSQPKEIGRARLSVTIAAIKLLIHPALAWFMLTILFDTSSSVTAPVMMIAAAPCGAMAFVLALNYQVRVDAIARAILYSSIGSLLTITLAASL